MSKKPVFMFNIYYQSKVYTQFMNWLSFLSLLTIGMMTFFLKAS